MRVEVIETEIFELPIVKFFKISTKKNIAIHNTIVI
ncbi:hypothetical protein CLORY_44600 [Clostridium oryzae]|uniref:Uncharacterized protein n=1 Tax=Clostridium oryzae TaxID=1450648 RepID=A0A1V4I5P4_9CLOT|nr:hypothetical protein CLORY_44600 [Clostridium oryzae]